MGKHLLMINGATGRTVLKDSDSYARENGPEGGEMGGRENSWKAVQVKRNTSFQIGQRRSRARHN